MFDRERARLEAVLGPLILRIEHTGSTAVPRLAAKLIIDILVAFVVQSKQNRDGGSSRCPRLIKSEVA
jgi:GrpB-like predicted nucleotidyltransferase (UPF0157 family)